MGCGPSEERPVNDNSDKDFKFKVKICFQGNIAVGKSLYYNTTRGDVKYFKDKCTDPHGAYEIKYVTMPSYGRVLAILGDTFGDETWFPVTSMLINGSNVIMLLYSIDKVDSFYNIENFWLEKIESVLDFEKTVILLIGNKVDLAMEFDENGKVIRELSDIDRLEKGYVTKQKGMDLAKKHNFLFSEASAIKGINIASNLEWAVRAYLDKIKDNL